MSTVIELRGDSVPENGLACEAWFDLREYLIDAHRALSMERRFRGLEIGLTDCLHKEVVSRNELHLILLRVRPVRTYGLDVTFDSDLLFLHYSVSGDPVARDLFAFSPAGSCEHGFRTREGITMTAEELGRSMLTCLTSCK